MPVMEWRGQKLRFGEEGLQLTLKQARVVKHFTGLRVVAFQTALQDMVEQKDLDPDLMQAFLWLLLSQNGQPGDIADLDDVTLEELSTALGSLVADGVPAIVDPTRAGEPDPQPSDLPRSSSTPTSTVSEPNISSNSHITAGSAL